MSNQPSEICKVLTQNITHPVILDSVKRIEVNYLASIIGLHVIGIILLFLFKSKFLYLQERSLITQFIMLIGNGLCFYVVTVRDVYIGRSNFSCVEVVLFNQAIIFLTTAPLFANYTTFLYKLRLQREDVRIRNIKDLRRKSDVYNNPPSSFNDESRNESSAAHVGSVTSNFCSQFYDFVAFWKMEQDHTSTHLPTDGIADQLDVHLHPIDQNRNDEKINIDNKNKKKKKFRYFSNKTMLNLILPFCFSMVNILPYLIIAFVRILADPVYANNCNGCPLNYVDIAAILGASLLHLVFTIYIIYVTRNEPDPLGTKREFITCLAFGTPFSIISWVFIITDPNSMEKNGLIVWQIIEITSILVCVFVTTYLQIVIAFYQRWSILNDKCVTLDLDKMLDDEPCRRVLLRHCANELSSENILFLLEAREWKMLSSSGSPRPVLFRELMKIYNTFISRSGATQVNVSATSVDRVQIRIEEYRSNPGLPIESNILDAVMRECSDVVLYDTLPRFRKTRLFKLEIIETGIIDKIVSVSSLYKSSGIVPSAI